MMSSEQLPTAPFLDRTATAATHQQAPRSYQNQHHNHNQRRNATSLLLPPHSHSHSHSHANTSANTSANVNVNVNANARRTAQQTSLPLNESDDHVLPLSYDSSRSNGNNSNNNDPYHYNYHSDQAPRKPQRSVVRAAESGRGSLLPIRHTTTAKGSLSPTPQQRQHQQQRPVSPKPHQHHHQQQQQQQLGRSQSQGLPRTQQDIVGEDNNNSNGNGNGKVVSKVGHLRRRTGGNVSSDDEFDAMATTSASTSNNGDSLYNGRSTGRRKRPGSSVSLNSMGNNSATNTNNHNNHHHHHNNNNNYSSGSSGREHPGPNSNYPGGGGGVAVCQKQLILIKLSRMKLGHLLQVVIVLAVVALVYESHHKALFATQQLTQFKDEESLLLLHLQKIEQQSIQLHENLGRLAQAHMENRNNGDNNNNNDGNNNNNDGANENDDNNKRNDLDDVTGNDREVDFDLIHKQTQQLYQMEEELSHEVQTLQKRIQLSARNHIIREFGEGPVQVVLELGFGNNGNERGHEHGHGHDDPSSSAVHKISILLWHDTPHAAWTWLEQIGNHLWDGAELHWQQGNIIETIPNEDRLADYYYAADRDRSSFGGGSSIGNGGSNGIEFVEQSQHAHQAWTVGVREHPVRTRDGSSSRNALGMYINLQDNSKLHTHEACVGKIIDGFDALQKILEATRSQHKNNGNGNANGNGKDGVGETSSSSSSTVVIRKATAMHYVTKKAGMG
eukprot:jgi/Psemu1/67952/estExt_Genemark1.C_4020015